MDTPADDDTVGDVAFALEGTSLPRDHAVPLAQALCARLAWLAALPAAGIHPVKVVPGHGAWGLLSQRARLLLRLPLARLPALAALSGCSLDVGGCALRLGAPRPRELLAHSTLYAPFVAAEDADEALFMQAVAREMQAMQIGGHSVCGRRQRIGAPGPAITGFSLMLHGLAPADSLRLQRSGLGPHRLFGCGIFVPHRSAAAVGA
ncbi:MAG: type I-MYXAN CRISPR-associated protein Cas6/Cmx6 [Burkholderiales bacterium]|nr:type I-MYXAN CRISPR-associated protein Cas6/Cmx6 [Burkholderiales bacterium]MDE2299242.1 type I-MYXAN CRISPR-associated protein Cas6/Cmx6 [Burkholderiales bacterium]MDE2628789.1 type I-MYXAN CRISPR-associated protein Cas6/Cmx6 [Burkholderiales bacterium]